MFYTIQNENLLTAEEAKSLSDYYANVQELTNVTLEQYNQNPSQYELIDGVLVDISDTAEYLAQKLQEAKGIKLSENELKRNVEYLPLPSLSTEVQSLFIKTQTPLGDLKSALPLYEKLANANNGLPANALRLYTNTGEVVLSPMFTLNQVNTIILDIAMGYIAIDTKSTNYTLAINSAETVEAVEAIEIDYGGVNG